jgi:hypothetical protein
LQQQAEVAKTWCKVVRQRLSNFVPDAVVTPAQVRVAQCELRLKTIELKMAEIQEKSLRDKLAQAWKQEGKEIQDQLAVLQHTVETVRLYPKLIAMRPRTTFFFVDCMRDGFYGIGRWYCALLAERPRWRRYAASKWFTSPSTGKAIWAPLGVAGSGSGSLNVMMDWTDQEQFSNTSSSIPGSEWIWDKAKFATCLKENGGVNGLKFISTWYIHKKKWSAAPSPTRGPTGWDTADAASGLAHAPESAELGADIDARCWFLKETCRNYAVGTFVKGSIEECFAAAEEHLNYVVQPHYADPMLISFDRKKFHTRLYVFAHSPAGATDLDFYIYDLGLLSIADKPWHPESQDRDVQITRGGTLAPRHTFDQGPLVLRY